MKTSLILLLIQFLNILTGFFSIYFVASNISPELYSIIGLNAIICAFVTTFSFIGYENVLSRNILYWQRIGCKNKIKYIISNTLYSKVILSFLIMGVMTIYVKLYSDYKLDSNYLIELSICTLGSLFYSLNTSFTLIQRGFNRFISAAICSLITGTLLKALALVIFNYYGFIYFIYVTAFSPIIITIYFYISLRDHIKYKYFNLKIKTIFIKNKNFIASNYLNFTKNFLDQIIISIFLSPDIFSTYTLMKRLEDILRLIIENIFDPLSQKLVFFKNTPELKIKKQKIQKICNILILTSIILTIISIPYIPNFIEISHLKKYPFLEFSIIIVIVSQIFYLISKPNINLIALFLPSKVLLKFSFYPIIINLAFSFVIILTMPNEYLFINRIVVYLASLIMAIHYVKTQNNCSYV